jgi:folate-binding protein YgfZ
MSKQDNTKNLTSINSLCSTIKFSGDGVVGFLNNLLISDLVTFSQNQLYYSALCNPKGRIISSLFICIKDPKHVFLYCPENMESKLIQFFTLRKFRLKFSITTHNQSSDILLDKDKSDFHAILTTSSYTDFYQALFKNNLPWIDANSTEKFIPQHVNLDQHKDIMSFTKGCYPGQEIIARLKYLGKIKKRMKLLKADSYSKLEQNHKLVSPIIEVSFNQFQVQTFIDSI